MRTQSVFRTISPFIALLMLAPVGASAALIAYDDMSGYTGGNLSGQGQGAGWTGNWSSGQSAFTAVPTSDLTYSGLTGATGLGRVSNYGGAGIYRTTSLISSGTLYFGALVKPNNTTNGIRLIDMSGPNNNAVLIGQYGANPWNAFTTLLYLDLRPEGQGVSGQVGLGTGIGVTTATSYWVAKIQFDTNGTLDDVRFFVNPASAADLANNVGVSARINNQNIGALNTFSAYVDGSTGFDFDEVRIGTEATDMFGAVPEPELPLILSILLAAVAVTRRR